MSFDKLTNRRRIAIDATSKETILAPDRNAPRAFRTCDTAATVASPTTALVGGPQPSGRREGVRPATQTYLSRRWSSLAPSVSLCRCEDECHHLHRLYRCEDGCVCAPLHIRLRLSQAGSEAAPTAQMFTAATCRGLELIVFECPHFNKVRLLPGRRDDLLCQDGNLLRRVKASSG